MATTSPEPALEALLDCLVAPEAAAGAPPLPAHDARARLSGKLVLLYFGASWCPPCRAFSPALSQFARVSYADVAVVHVPLDRTQQEADAFVAGKGFYVAPLGSTARDACLARWPVSSVPTLVVVDFDSGRTVTTWGRLALSANPVFCVREWRRGRSGVSALACLCPALGRCG